MAHRVHCHARHVLPLIDLLTIIFLVFCPFQRSYSLSPAQFGGWVEVPIPAIDGFKISFADSLHGWIISSNGTILYTNDAGATWQQRQCPAQIVDAELVANQAGWVRPSAPPGSDTLLYKSTDTGLSWVAVRLPRRLFFAQTVSFISESIVYAGLDLSYMWATTDGGESWTQRGILSGLAVANMDFFDVNTGYAGNAMVGQATPATLIKTTDGGFNWTTIQQSSEPGAFGPFRFINGKLGCYDMELHPEIGPPFTALLITWNQGESWIYFSASFKTGMARDTSHIWLLRYSSGTIRRTTNGGATWQEDTLSVPITDILYDLHGHQFALGTGRLFRYDSTLTSVDEAWSAPHEFVLSQNYPNPFNPSTTISFTIPHSSFVKIKVFDVLGRAVATLVDEEKPLGAYNVQWDGSNHPSGIYFCRLTAGSLSKTMKAMLIK